MNTKMPGWGCFTTHGVICVTMFQIGYVVFLIIYCYVILDRLKQIPTWTELYTIAFIFTMALEKIRQVSSTNVLGRGAGCITSPSSLVYFLSRVSIHTGKAFNFLLGSETK